MNPEVRIVLEQDMACHILVQETAVLAIFTIGVWTWNGPVTRCGSADCIHKCKKWISTNSCNRCPPSLRMRGSIARRLCRFCAF